MKKGSCLVNIGRGGLVDNNALAQALESGETIASAGMDVTNPEPLPMGHPLRQSKRCTILPHRGSAAKYSRDAMAEKTVKHCCSGCRAGEAAKPVTSLSESLRLSLKYIPNP